MERVSSGSSESAWSWKSASSSEPSTNSRSDTAQHRLKRKRDDSDDEDHRPKRSRSPSSIGDSTRLFSCPFLKHFPTHHHSLRTCAAGWPSISRLKEHLVRKHEPKSICPRCRTTFKSRRALDEHLLSFVTVPCPVVTGSNEDELHLTPEAQQMLCRRTRKGENPERAWIQIYKACFPGTPSDLIPTPYVDAAEDERECIRQHVCRDVMKQLKNRVPDMVKKELNHWSLPHEQQEIVRLVVANVLHGLGDLLDAGTPSLSMTWSPETPATQYQADLQATETLEPTYSEQVCLSLGPGPILPEGVAYEDICSALDRASETEKHRAMREEPACFYTDISCSLDWTLDLAYCDSGLVDEPRGFDSNITVV